MYYYRDINDIETKNSFVAKLELTDNFQDFMEQCHVKLKLMIIRNIPKYIIFAIEKIIVK